MRVNEQEKMSPEAAMSQETFARANAETINPQFGTSNAEIPFDEAAGASADASHSEGAKSKWEADVVQTLELGKQFLQMGVGIIGLARAEASLSVRTIPKLLTVWLLMLPVIVLTWCAFSLLVSWIVTGASNEIGLGIFTFFLLQVLLLLVCYWLTVRYRSRIGFGYTRTQIKDFIRSTQHEIDRGNKTAQ